MFNIQKYLRHVVLALGLAALSLTASASLLPTYKIAAPDTITADIAYIDFVFNSMDGAALVKASLTNFAGITVGEIDPVGDVTGIAGGFSIGNGGAYNDLYLPVNGPFSFDLNFSESFLKSNSPLNDNGSFTIALYDSNEQLIGDSSGALQFSLSNSDVTVTSTSSLLSVTAVPEPTDWMLMLTGLVFVVYLTRKNDRANVRRLAAA